MNLQLTGMRITKFFFLVFLLFITLVAVSQSKNPYKSIGKKSETLTLSKGKYEELFDQDSIQQIGTALINVRTMKVVKLLKDEKEAKERLQNEKQSRFLSVDPLTKSYPELTPYQFAGNTPIQAIDLDGAEPMYVIDSKNYNDHDYSKKENRKAAGKALLTYVTASDINDATIIATSITRKEPINIDGEKANKVDKGFAYAGALIPFVSGSTISKLFKAFSKADNGLKVVGYWVKKNHHMSDIAKRYQKQINGIAGDIDYKYNGVNFDGVRNDVLLEAKGLGYKRLFNDVKIKDDVIDKLVNQAQRQIKAADGKRVEWNFAEKEAADFFRNELEERGIKGIEVKYTALEFKNNGK